MLETFRAGAVKYAAVESNDPFVLENNDSPIVEDCNSGVLPVESALHPRTSLSTSHSSPVHARVPGPFDEHPPIRTVSRESSTRLRHPTPDLQSLQGAYVGNVERLEETAERLSLSSDIGEELRKIRSEQKRSESRSSSIRAAQVGQGALRPSLSRQFSSTSNPSTPIQGINSLARSGGFSNGFITSPIGSFRSTSWTHHSPRPRQTSQADRLSRVEEPDREDRTREEDQTDLESSPRQLQVRNCGLKESPVNFEGFGEERPRRDLQPVKQQTGDEVLERPTTALSTDTYQQGMHLFADFDGVHLPSDSQLATTPDEHPTLNHRSSILSLGQTPLQGKRRSRLEPPAGSENMTYYPAPVPVMLNLPQKLSKVSPASRREQRYSQMKDAIVGQRKSTLGLPELFEKRENGHNSRLDLSQEDLAALPPQLRAGMFFEHKSIQNDVTIKGDSAVATLDSILDASAFAPVSAFIDHPIVGQVGKEVYGRMTARSSMLTPQQPMVNKRRSMNSLNILKTRLSSATVLDGKRRNASMASGTIVRDSNRTASNTDNRVVSGESDGAQRSSRIPGEEDLDDEDSEIDLAPEEMELPDDHDVPMEGEEEDAMYTGAPTTLLAELQLRKQEQKLRVRNAATAFPNGMHSTLLQLDAVAQVQRQSRKHKHITLAWEDPHLRNSRAENEADENVPLGVLYPGRKAHLNEPAGWHDENQPLGLIAKRAMEDNEPLSRRRARLKGAPTVPRSTTTGPRDSTYTLDIPGLTTPAVAAAPEPDSETLAQRLRRLKAQSQNPMPAAKPYSSDLLHDVLSPFGGPLEPPQPAIPTDRVTPNPDETLGQRRKRLQAEKEASSESAQPLQPRYTMADILHARRPGAPRSASYTSAAPAPYVNSLTYGQSAAGYVGVGAVLPLGREELPIEPRQRDMINRWRQSVMN
ncbi:hypothetical protein MMC17_009848 [Xylographa soralifera]|nr:hypothetical protein [Xylographa soralifera]